FGARIAAVASAAAQRAVRRGNLGSRVGVKAARGAGMGSCPSSVEPNPCGTLIRGMGSPDRVTDQARVRVSLDGSGESNGSSGLPGRVQRVGPRETHACAV